MNSAYHNGFDEKGSWPAIDVGTNTTGEKLVDLYRRGQLAQVYLFYGEFGQTAEILATHVLADSTRLTKDFIAQHVRNRTFPNFFCVESETHEITVDKVRELSSFLQDTPTWPGWRIVIIKNAETMNTSASNAILKNMEELPKNTTMILLAQSLHAIKPTILSRAQKVYFPYKSSPIENFINENNYAREWIVMIENALKRKQIPSKERMDTVANEAQNFAEVAMHYLHTQCIKDAKNAYPLSMKYDEIANFTSLAAEKSLAPAHFALAIFSVLVK
ncbi:MAG: DNA polymerase III subunit [Holosporales bacterium]|jgi:hypothetical protein|nr:DNA polymerase III subunit [Holosporales bacterium]